MKTTNGVGRAGMVALAALSAWGLTGCGPSYLANRQTIDRAHLTETPVPAVAASAPASDVSGMTGIPGAAVTGTYLFTVPATMSLVKETNGDEQRYQIFVGQPAPADKPIVTVTVGANESADSVTGTGGLAVSKTRTYLLNNIPVHEWQGYTAEHKPFCEILGRYPGAPEDVHALAIGRTPDLGKQALGLLATLHWTADKDAAAATNP